MCVVGGVGGVVITVTDSVYVSVGAVEANRLDNASDREDLQTGRARAFTFTLRFCALGSDKDIEHLDQEPGVTL